MFFLIGDQAVVRTSAFFSFDERPFPKVELGRTPWRWLGSHLQSGTFDGPSSKKIVIHYHCEALKRHTEDGNNTFICAVG
jgi:hypothetical protein